MATPADQRLTELLERWLTSLELHLKYSSLDDDTYWQVQPWVEHQRPARWILDLAKQKTTALKAQVEERVEAGDADFSDALEQMMFLANLVGLQHIERFIPVAEPDREQARGDATAATGTREMPRPSTATTGTREMPRPALATGATREMPRPPVKPEKKRPRRSPRPRDGANLRARRPYRRYPCRRRPRAMPHASRSLRMRCGCCSGADGGSSWRN